MEAATLATSTVGIVILTVTLIWVWRLLNWVWLKPKKLEKLLRDQGLQGNRYRLLVGDVNDFMKTQKEASSKPMNLSDDIVPRVISYTQQSLAKHGKNCFVWFGPTPRVTLTDHELIKEVLNKTNDFKKPNPNPLASLLAAGLASLEGDKWSKHRRIINPAFNLEKLKMMLPIFFKSCNDLIHKWEEMVSEEGSCEMDVWPFLQNLASDVISRAAFGSSYEEGIRIFELQREQAKHTMRIVVRASIPGWRFLPTTTHRRMKEIDRDIKSSLTSMINKRERALKAGEATKNNLLDILLESNNKEIEEHGNKKNIGMSLEDVIAECKLFYFAGQETTSVLLVWTMILLSRHPDWQARAREEVLRVFGNKKPDFDGLTHLKIVTMILYEVLRLYPPGTMLTRAVPKEVKLGHLTLPAGVQVSLPIVLLHHDNELWGKDAKKFNPERFSEGVLKATNGKVSFLPFGGGPRICIGQNFSMVEAKMAITMILQHFSFELSPTYAHAPSTVITLQPQYGGIVAMTTPYGGRGRGRGSHGRGRGSNNLLPFQELNISLIGDWTTVTYNKNKQMPKKEEASSSKSQNKIISYKETAVNDPPQEQVSEYFENPVTEKIMYIEHDDINLANNDGWSVKTRYLESRGYPGLFGKSRPNLEILLTIIESVTITHHYQNNNPESFINFSKCHINKILLPREWGLNPNGEKAIKIAEGKYIYFNYWDYIQAFTQAFYYQNPKNKHSWFFSINSKVVDSEIPNWFYEWWIKFGPSLEILPEEISGLYNSWCDNSPLITKVASNNLITGQCPALFFIKFQIPWIWRWSLKISKDGFHIPILERNFFYKWWNKMSSEDISIITNSINNTVKEDESIRLKGHDTNQFSLAQMKSYFQRKYPKESEEEIMIRTLDYMKTQFFRTFPTRGSKEDTMSTSSQGSVEILAGESQPIEPTPEDVGMHLSRQWRKKEGRQMINFA